MCSDPGQRVSGAQLSVCIRSEGVHLEQLDLFIYSSLLLTWLSALSKTVWKFPTLADDTLIFGCCWSSTRFSG